MSYFVFGLVDVVDDRIASSQELQSQVRESGTVVGLCVLLDGADEPPMLEEMRGGLGEASVRFMLTKRPSDDTSDSLISPFVVGVDGAIAATLQVSHWIRKALMMKEVARVRIWFTDGWEDQFELQECSVDDFHSRVARRVVEEQDFPSLQLIVTSSTV